jgi:hypothetical protein
LEWTGIGRKASLRSGSVKWVLVPGMRERGWGSGPADVWGHSGVGDVVGAAGLSTGKMAVLYGECGGRSEPVAEILRYWVLVPLSE